MKRFCALLSVALIFIALGLDSDGLMKIGDLGGDMTYYFFVSGADAEIALPAAPKEGNFFEVVSHGGGAEVRCGISDAKRVKRNLKNVRGEAVSFKGTREDAEKLKRFLRVKIKSYEEFEDIYTYYGYTADLGNGIGTSALNIDGMKINIQVAYRGGRITVGTPVILGGY